MIQRASADVVPCSPGCVNDDCDLILQSNISQYLNSEEGPGKKDDEEEK